MNDCRDWFSRLGAQKNSLVSSRKGRVRMLLAGIGAAGVIAVSYFAAGYFKMQDYEARAKMAYSAKSYRDALENYQHLADAGNSEAMFRTADMYLSGQGTVKNASRGLKYLRMAADRGSLEAALRLGLLYFAPAGESRTCVEHNYRLAREWLEKAGKQPEALLALGTIYQRGLGVPRDELRAQNYFDEWARTYMIKAEQGDPEAQYQMGLYFTDGIRHAADDERAIHWYELSARQDYVKALEALASIYTLGGSKIKPDPAKADAVFQDLIRIYEKNARGGDVDALLALGDIYRSGVGIPQDYAKSVSYLIQAIEKNSPAAMLTLADLLDSGQVVNRVIYQREQLEKERNANAARIRKQMEELRLKKEEEARRAREEAERAAQAAENPDGTENPAAAASPGSEAPAPEPEDAAGSPVTILPENPDLPETPAEPDSDANADAPAEDSILIPEDDEFASSRTEDAVSYPGMPDPVQVDFPEYYTAEKLRQLAHEEKIKLAGIGDVTIMKELAFDALSGVGTGDSFEYGANYSDAIKWFTRASQAGEDAEAMFELGHIYQTAEDRSIRNNALADAWYQKSADLCYTPAYIGLGSLYGAKNTGIEDARVSHSWYEKAAKLGNQDAQMALAHAFAEGGRGAQPDFREALKWLLVVRISLEKAGDTRSRQYQDILKLEDDFEYHLQPEEINEARAAADNMHEIYGTDW